MPPTRPDAPAWSPGLQILPCLPSQGSLLEAASGESGPHTPRGAGTRPTAASTFPEARVHRAAELRRAPDPALGRARCLSVCLPLCFSLSVWLSGSLSVHLCLFVSVSLSPCLSLPVCLAGSLSLLVCLPGSFQASLSVILCFFLSVSPCLSPSVCLSVSPRLPVSVALSLCLYLCPPVSLAVVFSPWPCFPSLCLPVWLFPRVSPSLTVCLSVSLSLTSSTPFHQACSINALESLELQGDPTSPS